MRRKQKYKKEIEPDLEYNSPIVAKFVNAIMKDGKKTVAEKVVYGALKIIKEETQKEPLEPAKIGSFTRDKAAADAFCPEMRSLWHNMRTWFINEFPNVETIVF